MQKFWLAVSITLFCVSPARPQTNSTDEILAGHSYHGEAFNEGPRQKPYLMEGLGQCHFEISTPETLAQSFFNQGVDQLHGFWYFEAERSFRQVAMLDPDCAMAYWGLAMANINNKERAEKFIEQAREKITSENRSITTRERMYISALGSFYDERVKEKKRRAENLTKQLEDIVLEYPDDIEAKAFLACQVWMNKREDIKIASHVGINALLDDVFSVAPNHPAHHYRIHLWDYEDPEVALHSAAMCGPSLPDIAHMWHMPGHIYSRLNRYEDAVWQQEASARVDHRNMMDDSVMPDQIHNFAHNNEWCIRNLIHVGRIGDAIDLANNMLSLPRHPKYNTLDKNGSSKYGRQRLFQVLSTYEMWSDLIVACQSNLYELEETTNQKIKRLRYLGRAYFRSQDTNNGKSTLKNLETELADAEKNMADAKLTAQTEIKEQTNQFRIWMSAFDLLTPTSLRQVFAKQSERSIRRDHRIRLDKAVADAIKPFEEQINLAKRAIDEMKGYCLLAEEKYDDALKCLEKAGGVDAVYRAYVKHLGGKTKQALKDARKFVATRTNEVQPLAMLTWLLWECGEQEEAVLTFGELCAVSGSIDISAEFFEKLNPVREFAQIGEDWLVAKRPASDLGQRPALDLLGPFRWQPTEAPAWTLLDSQDNPVSLSHYSGQPVIVIFYLGHGCLHCAEQLQAFAPRMNDYLDSGIELLAISTDERIGLKKSIDSYGETPLPIRLLANPELTIFKKYHAFDEFENQPLHGTFLIDGQGKIRWQDISYEPFMDCDFLLSESKRLLGYPSAR